MWMRDCLVVGYVLHPRDLMGMLGERGCCGRWRDHVLFCPLILTLVAHLASVLLPANFIITLYGIVAITPLISAVTIRFLL